MNEAYVKFDVAKLLKEKGFDWECLARYDKPIFSNNVSIFTEENAIDWNTYYYGSDYKCSAPTQQMACRWLIKTHNIHIEPHFLRESGDYVYNIIHSPLELDDIHSFPIVFNTREDAVEAALKYCLTNLI